MRNPITSRTSFTLFIAQISLAAASCAQVDADIPDTKVTQKAVSFQGVPGVPGGGEASITESFTLSADDLSWTKELNADVYAYEVELKAVSGVEDLGFIHHARITMSAGDDPTIAPIEVVNYNRPENYTASPILDVPTAEPVNVTTVWAANKVVFTLYLTGVFPEQDWAADITLHLSGKLSYKL
jgi:hypothetical protein